MTLAGVAQHVDWLPAEALGLQGRLGLTCAPGLFIPGAPLDAGARLRAALGTLVEVHGAGALVTLLDRFEAAEHLGPDLRKVALHLGLESLSFPIADGWVPTSMDEAIALVTDLLGRLRRGQNVVLHCLAGLGRSGTIAACCAVGRGRAWEEAIALVRAARPGAVQNPTQERFVAEFAEAWAGRAG